MIAPTKTTVRLWEVPVNGLPTCTGLIRKESPSERVTNTLRRERARILAREEIFVIGSYNANDFAQRVTAHMGS